MIDADWMKLASAAVGGGLFVKLLDIGYQEIRRRGDHSRSATHFVDQHLDPVLKAADELVGKLRSLADEGFKSLRNVSINADRFENADFTSLVFLFGRFWASIERLRREGLAVSIVQDSRGRRLQKILDSLESTPIRIIDRISQRAIAELMLVEKNGRPQIITFVEFMRLLEDKSEPRRWMYSLMHTVARSMHTTERQKLLRYGIVVHAMIDNLDPKHAVTRDRPSYSSRLSKKSWEQLKYQVFGVYLKFVRTSEKYLGPPKRRP